jgi:hypothetical protein
MSQRAEKFRGSPGDPQRHPRHDASSLESNHGAPGQWPVAVKFNMPSRALSSTRQVETELKTLGGHAGLLACTLDEIGGRELALFDPKPDNRRLGHLGLSNRLFGTRPL